MRRANVSTSAQSSSPLADGAAYDPVEQEWRELSPAPVGASREVGAVWTGEEVIVVTRGVAPSASGDVQLAAAAWDPQTNRWRSLAPSPPLGDVGSPGRAGSAVWTGDEVITMDPPLAYDPVDDSWHRLPDPPLEPTSPSQTWNGRELLVLGRFSGGGVATALSGQRRAERRCA